MPVSLLSVDSFTTVDATLAIAQQRSPGAGDAFVALSSDKQGYAVTTAATGIKALDFGYGFEVRPDAAWRLSQANIEYALYLAPWFSDDAVSDPLNPEVADEANIKRTKTGPLETEFFSRPVFTAGSLDVFPPVVRTLLAPLLESAAPVRRVQYGQGKAYRVS